MQSKRDPKIPSILMVLAYSKRWDKFDDVHIDNFLTKTSYEFDSFWCPSTGKKRIVKEINSSDIHKDAPNLLV